jgi:mono/diheme cytochrome c family protein
MARRYAASVLALVSCAAIACSIGCGTRGDEALHCDDLLPAEQADYAAVAALVVEPGPKSCGSCHNTETPLSGYNFEGPGVAYDALSTKMEIIYTQVASGEMPETGQQWDEDDLKLLRSWYCNGAFYDD